MKFSVIVFALLTATQLYSAEAPQEVRAAVAKDGTVSYQALIEGKYQTVPASFVGNMALDLADKAKEAACKLKVRPSQVTVSVTVMSFTWDTEKLCGK